MIRRKEKSMKLYHNFTAVLKDLNDNYEASLYVDKSLFIRNLIECPYSIIFVLKPRRWGKSLSNSMIKFFLQINNEKDFKELISSHFKIKLYPSIIDNHFQKYPIISLNLNFNFEIGTDSILKNLKNSVSNCFLSHYYLRESPNLKDFEKQKYSEICQDNFSQTDLYESIKLLCKLLKTHYQTDKNVYILIDDYDFIPNCLLEEYSKELDFEKKKTILGLFNSATDMISQFIYCSTKNNEYFEKFVVYGVNNIIPIKDFYFLNNSVFLNNSNDFIFHEDFGISEEEANKLILALNIEHEDKGLIETNLINFMKKEFQGYMNMNDQQYFPIVNVLEYLINYSFSKFSFDCEPHFPVLFEEMFSIYDKRFSNALISLFLNGKLNITTRFYNKSIREYINLSTIENLFRTIFLNNFELRIMLLLNYGALSVSKDDITKKDLLIIPNSNTKKYLLEKFLKWEYPIIEENDESFLKISFSLEDDALLLSLLKNIIRRLDKSVVQRLNETFILSLVGLSVEKNNLVFKPNEKNSYFTVFSEIDEKNKIYESIFDSINIDQPMNYNTFKIISKEKQRKDIQTIINDVFFESIVRIFYKKVIKRSLISKSLLLRVIIFYEEELSKWIIFTQTVILTTTTITQIIDFVTRNFSSFEQLKDNIENTNLKSIIMKLNDDFLKTHFFNKRRGIVSTCLYEEETTSTKLNLVNIKIEERNEEIQILPKDTKPAEGVVKIKVCSPVKIAKSKIVHSPINEMKEEIVLEDENESESDDISKKDFFYEFVKNCSHLNRSFLIKNIYKLLDSNETLSIENLKTLGLRKIATRILEDEDTKRLHKKYWELKKKKQNDINIQTFFLKYKRKRPDNI